MKLARRRHNGAPGSYWPGAAPALSGASALPAASVRAVSWASRYAATVHAESRAAVNAAHVAGRGSAHGGAAGGITSRNPGDLPAFSQALLRQVSGGIAPRLESPLAPEAVSDQPPTVH